LGINVFAPRHSPCSADFEIVDTTFFQSNVDQAAQAWNEVVNQFRALCLMRQQGKTSDYGAILERQLPDKISAWAKTAAPDAAAKRSQLEAMFREEKKRIEDAVALQELTAAQFQEKVLPGLIDRISEQVKTLMAGQVEANARLREELAREIKDAMAEQNRQEAARQASQQAFIQFVERTLGDLGRSAAALTQQAAQAAAQSATQPVLETAAAPSARLDFDGIPTIVESSAAQAPEEPLEEVRKPFAARPRPRSSTEESPSTPSLLGSRTPSFAAA